MVLTDSLQPASLGTCAGLSCGPSAHECFVIHKYSVKDKAVLQQIGRLERHIFDKTACWASIVEEIAQKKGTLLLWAAAKDSCDQVAGYIFCTVRALVLHVGKLAVAPDLRRQGLGRALLQEALEVARRQKPLDFATLLVHEDNAAAQLLYRSIGFSEDGVMPDYYRPGQHALKMIFHYC